MATSIRLWIALFVIALAGCASGQDEPLACELASTAVAPEALSSLSCNMSKATGYKAGAAFSIQLVTVDGKKVEWRTANAYMRMAKAASKAGVEIRIVSGFRSMAEQKYLYGCYVNCNCNSCNEAAKPGYSNHQSGHALDLDTSAAGVLGWLTKHGASYGFSRTVPGEAWHWEWWGKDPGDGPCHDDDPDQDGVENAKDNCPAVHNSGQTDSDGDGEGNQCDADDDDDGVKDEVDDCTKVENPDQVDSDGDGQGDACDEDDDGDSVADAADACPLDGEDGCTEPETGVAGAAGASATEASSYRGGVVTDDSGCSIQPRTTGGAGSLPTFAVVLALSIAWLRRVGRSASVLATTAIGCTLTHDVDQYSANRAASEQDAIDAATETDPGFSLDAAAATPDAGPGCGESGLACCEPRSATDEPCPGMAHCCAADSPADGCHECDGPYATCTCKRCCVRCSGKSPFFVGADASACWQAAQDECGAGNVATADWTDGSC